MDGIKNPVSVDYDNVADILTFSFTKKPKAAIAEEVNDDIWVRYDPKTYEMITLDILHFAVRLKDNFGSSLIYKERTDPDILESLTGISYVKK